MGDYEPFGEEWEKEMMKLPKKFLVELLKKKCESEQNIINGLNKLDKETEE